ncbi:hypothetical protein [Shewanella woodyi]|uniref:hypothetical protein n=1 Tax=Shewanella woodyi TaxID=60961 RepID=UPI003747E3A1
MQKFLYLALLCLSLVACGQSEPETKSAEQKPSPPVAGNPKSNLAIPDNRQSNHYRILLYGNSHTARQAGLIKRLISTSDPERLIDVENAGGGFLDDNLASAKQVAKLEDGSWTHVILQGQKYSQSGSTTYPTTAAQHWIEKTKVNGATPILFPEHPQRGNLDEGQRIHRLHTAISQQQKSCVAPIGLTWDKVLLTSPQLPLHHSDGNHASLTGSMLTALVFYEVITGNSADLLPYIPEIDVDEPIQQLLGQIASETLQSSPPCQFGR